MKISRSPRYSERFDYQESDEAEASSPPSSSPPVREDRFQYDVFLSFRGPDTRNGFTGFLHYALEEKGIDTFMDSEQLVEGQKVLELFDCIQRSQIFVPIFSEGYADSDWCLKEIAKMVECGRLIIPVFFDVEPSDVRNQTGPFANAFRKWYENREEEEVSTWSAALRKAGEVKGFKLADTNGYQAKLVQLIVERILIEVNKTPLRVAKHPVGLHSRIGEVIELLDVEAREEVKIVGIHAMGGMGKTTLAKAVYNQISTLFDGCSFIKNVREATKQSTGPISLQKQLLCDILNDDNVNVNTIDQGIGIIEKRIGKKKVLLVLDDVDHESQLNGLVGGIDWFCSGSRIIITTRSQQVLGALRMKKNEIYELKELDDIQSLQLFSWYAFGKEEPNAKFAELSKKAAATAAGLPLALEIFGSDFFHLKTIKQWREKLEILRKKQNNHIHEKLKISYDGLEEQEKTVFLDIACFFIGNRRKYATHMWEDCKFCPDITIDVLVKKSLVNIDDETGEFEMHDQIRDMGRKIIQDESPTSRLWKDADETLDVLQNKEGTKNVEVIQVFGDYVEDPLSVSTESFAAMSQLRMLWLGDTVRLEGEYAHFPLMLRWLKWCACDLDSLPDGLQLENIVVLDLSWSSITQLWDRQGPAGFKVFQKLKVLKLCGCGKLTSCPDFASMPHLQELDLYGCCKMTELHQSIGCLERLTHLSLCSCYKLEKLPVQAWQLTSLEEFDLSCCHKLTVLPSQMGDCKSLKQLSLKVLNLQDCEHLKTCPDFTSMPHLETLKLDRCYEMSEFSPSIRQLKSLTYLSLSCCKSLKKLPKEIWQLSSLEKLDLSDCDGITTWPSLSGDSESLKQLLLGNKLKVLLLNGCKNFTTCPDFMSMPHLEKLDLEGCEKLSELHPSIGHVNDLTYLNLKKCKSLKRLPLGILQLTSLEMLDLSYCSQITALTSQLEDSKSLKPLLLDKLEDLNLYHCENLTFCPDFTSMPRLKILNFGDCEKIIKLHPSIQHLTSLSHLTLSGCKSLKELPESLGQLKQLNSLHLCECFSLKEVPKCIVSLDMLEVLAVAGCEQLKFLPQLPPSLTMLDACKCYQLEKIENVSNLKVLQKLFLSGCERLVDIPGIQELKCLETLGLEGCRSLCNSLWKGLQEANFQHLCEFSISESQIESEASCQQSLSFLLPKRFETGVLYLHVDQSSLDSFAYRIALELDDIRIESDDEVDSLQGRDVRIDIMAEDVRYSFSTSVNDWIASMLFPLATFSSKMEIPLATFGSKSELMKKARDMCTAQRKTLIMMHVSMDGCALLHGDLFTTTTAIGPSNDEHGWLDYADDKVRQNICEGKFSQSIVKVKFG